MKIDWATKLGSRKFWALIAGFFGSLLFAFNMGENEVAQITGIITAFGSIVVYILAEASVDRAAVKIRAEEQEEEDKDEEEQTQE